MKQIAIITAMQEEADIIINKYQLTKDDSLWTIQKYIWEYNNKKIILIIAWIWKIQASIATSYLLSAYNNLDQVINIWIAWNLSDHAKIGDVFMINKCYQHDIYLPFDWDHLNYAKKYISLSDHEINHEDNFNIYAWICATWDQFIDDSDILKNIKENYNADVVEMEAFAILSTAREYNMLNKCIVIKAVSDGANTDAIWDHMNNLDFAMHNSIDVLDKII